MINTIWAAVWTVIVSAIAAIVASASNLVAKRRINRLQSQLNFVNEQLKDFYGPPLATAEACEQAWVAFKLGYKNDNRNFWSKDNPPTREQKVAYQHWIRTIFIPLNEEMVRVLSARLDLLIEHGVPQCLTDLYTHALTRKAELDLWQVDSVQPPNATPFPARELLAYLETSFETLKMEQSRLLIAISTTKTYPLTINGANIELMSHTWRVGTPRGATSTVVDDIKDNTNRTVES